MAAPIGAPVLGGALMTVLNWRGIFVVLGAIAVLLILLARWKLRETLPAERRRDRSSHRRVGSHHPPAVYGLLPDAGLHDVRHVCLYRRLAVCTAADLRPVTAGIQLVLCGERYWSGDCFQTSARLCPLWGEYRVLKGGLTLAFVASSCLLLAGVSGAAAAGAGGAVLHHRQ